MRDEELAEANSCLESFDVTMYRGEDGRCRIWGDINRIQDIIFSHCTQSFPLGARDDLAWFFAHEVDARIVHYLERLGVQVIYDPEEKVGFGFDDDEPSAEHMTGAFKAVFDWYRLPPQPTHFRAIGCASHRHERASLRPSDRTVVLLSRVEPSSDLAEDLH